MAGKLLKILAAAAVATATAVELGVPPCALMNVAYTSPEVKTVNGGYPPNAVECQRLCGSEQYVCDWFTFYAESRACWLMVKVDGVSSAPKIGAISGPKDCSLLQTSTTLTARVVSDAPPPPPPVPKVPVPPGLRAPAAELEPAPEPSGGSSSQLLPWWACLMIALGLVVCVVMLCTSSICCGEEKVAKRRTRGISKITAEDERVEKAVVADVHDEAAQPLIPQFLPRPSLPVASFGGSISLPAYTAAVPPPQQQVILVPAQRLVEVRSMPMPYSVMQAPAAISLDPSQLY